VGLEARAREQSGVPNPGRRELSHLIHGAVMLSGAKNLRLFPLRASIQS